MSKISVIELQYQNAIIGKRVKIGTKVFEILAVKMKKHPPRQRRVLFF